jgi:hypothetical protein
MGRADNRACFLTRMTGNFGTPQDEIHAAIDPATNNWFLTGNNGTHQNMVWLPGVYFTMPTNAEAAAILGIPVDQVFGVSAPDSYGSVAAFILVPNVTSAQARCITVKSLRAEGTWNQGDPPLTIGNNTDACFLTRIAGHFAGGGEEVEVVTPIGPTTDTVLTGPSGQTGVSASARCAVDAQVDAFVPFLWSQGSATVEMERIENFPACYFVKVGGHFAGGGEKVEIGAATFGGHLHWTLGGTSMQSGVIADSLCMKP